MSTASEKRRRLRERLNQDRILLLPGVYDGICARIVEQAGFDAVYMTGSGTAMARYGVPDIGLVTMSEMVQAQIREQAGISMMVQANQAPSIVLQLLK